MKKQTLKVSVVIIALFAIAITGNSQGRPETSKDIKNIVKTHSKVALMPFMFQEKKYNSLPEGVTQELIDKSEKEKGLSMQGYLHEKLSKKNGKRPYSWISIEETNKHVGHEGSYSDLAKVMGVDAVVISEVETPKIILPDEMGGEVMGDKNNLYGLSGSGTYVTMSIYTPGQADPIWKWKIKMNGTFKNTKLMMNTIAKNYLSEKFPYKF